jgi:hypothetical protein
VVSYLLDVLPEAFASEPADSEGSAVIIRVTDEGGNLLTTTDGSGSGVTMGADGSGLEI